MTIGQFPAFGNTANSAAEIAWSGIGAPTEYSNPQQQAGAETLGEGGPLTGMGSFQDVGTLFQEQLIRRMVYQGGGVVWDFNQVVEDKRGMPLNASGPRPSSAGIFSSVSATGFIAITTPRARFRSGTSGSTTGFERRADRLLGPHERRY